MRQHSNNDNLKILSLKGHGHKIPHLWFFHVSINSVSEGFSNLTSSSSKYARFWTMFRFRHRESIFVFALEFWDNSHKRSWEKKKKWENSFFCQVFNKNFWGCFYFIAVSAQGQTGVKNVMKLPQFYQFSLWKNSNSTVIETNLCPPHKVLNDKLFILNCKSI